MIQSIRGMNDLLPEQSFIWQNVENCLRTLIQSYGYQEIRLPLLESTALFKRAIGEVTDIVEKEMYTFLDRNDESVSLRPEGTAGCVRACIQHGLLHHQTQRLWYMGPMYRYERPQKGRYRQFYQLGVEAYGFPDTDIEVELMLMTHRLWHLLHLDKYLTLEINTLGTMRERKIYREHLVTYFKQHEAILDEDSQRRLLSNPLRILDSKNSSMQALIERAPRFLEYCGEATQKRFELLCKQLTQFSIPFCINPRLVRGLDYYNHTVFEWVTHDLGAQGTVCAGGRYDALIQQLGGNEGSAVGFGLGMERLILLLSEKTALFESLSSHVDIYSVFMGDQAEEKGRHWIETLRHQIPCRLMSHCGGGSVKSQWKKADKSGARIALILGEHEMEKNTVSIKFLREERPQIEISQKEAADFLKNYLKSLETIDVKK